jgi:hypothetical protein|tara:strand:- start:27 stop:503 length:477 start_codon:yes stop_codon:yes gene_type:complete
MKTIESSSNQKIEDWILDFLSKPNSAFDNIPPCPYAKKAWLDGNVEVKEFISFAEMRKDIDNWNKEVIIYLFQETMLPRCTELQVLASKFNDEFPDFLFLEETPELVEDVAGVIVNQGDLCMMIVQKRKELEEAREELKKTGYYDNWTDEMKERIMDR